MSIYVEIDIKGELARVWEMTQTPELHRRWDLRFTDIEYLPREEGQPQLFLYATMLSFGFRIAGKGESVAEKHGDGTAVSSLRFWSDDPKSLIGEGSGYWKYVQLEGKTRFVTGYDYQPRFGFPGALFDRLIFRPLIGWATSWSFDSMRLWLEKGIRPEEARARSLINLLSRLTLAFVWIYQGLVPKLLFPNAGELAIMQSAHVPFLKPAQWVAVVGSLEIAYGLLFVLLYRARWTLWLQLLALTILIVSAACTNAQLLIMPFNPVSLNMPLVVLGAIALIASHDLPSARNCRRTKGAEA